MHSLSQWLFNSGYLLPPPDLKEHCFAMTFRNIETWKLGCYLHQGYTKIIMIQSKSSVAINYINSDSGQITILV